MALALMAKKPTRINLCNIIYEIAQAHEEPQSYLDRVAEEVKRL